MPGYDTLRDHPIFICGHPKAGTSLLRSIFDSHPQLVVYPEETIFFRRYLPQASGQDLNTQIDLARAFLIHIFTWDRSAPPPSQAGYPDRDYAKIAFEEVSQAMEQIARQDYRHTGDILAASVLAYGKICGELTSDTRRWVEKSPYNEYYTQQIFAWWPAARCIHVLRDPRDNYASYRRKHPDWQPEFFAANWKRSTKAGLSNQERFGAQRYRLVRYEDLVTTPREQIEALVDFLGIDWDPSLTAPTRAGEQWQGNSMFANQFQQISAAPIGRWQKNLTTRDAAVIEVLSAPFFRTWHYHPKAYDASSWLQKLAVRLRAASWPFRRIFRRRRAGQ